MFYKVDLRLIFYLSFSSPMVMKTFCAGIDFVRCGVFLVGGEATMGRGSIPSTISRGGEGLLSESSMYCNEVSVSDTTKEERNKKHGMKGKHSKQQ